MVTRKAVAKMGAGLIAAGSAAAAGYYFYASKHAKKNRRVAARWASDFKKEVVKQAHAVKSLDRGALTRVVDGVAHMYETARKANREDILKAASELKGNFASLKKEVSGVVKSVKAARRTVQRVSTRAIARVKKAV